MTHLAAADTRPVPQDDTRSSPPPLPLAPALVWLMAITCGLVVANIYYNQPLLAEIGRTFNLSESRVSLMATITQVGYTLGLLFVVPLGDKRERKSLTLVLLLCAAACMAGAAVAPTFALLAAASLLIGLFSAVPQLLIPMAASLASDEERGRVVGKVMSGLLIGILLSRTISGYVGAQFGWRTMFWVGAGVMVVLTGILARMLPRNQPQFTGSYGSLLRSLGTLTTELPVLRRSALVGACMFAGFSAFWTTLVFFLESPAYRYGSEVTGLFGLIGASGAFAASFAGKSADTKGADYALNLGILLFLGAYLLLGLGGTYLLGLIAGVVILDIGQQMTHISNQTRIFTLRPEARSRLNTVYMTACFIGASTGSFVGGLAWDHFHWLGVCGVGLGFVVLAYLANRFYGQVAGARP
ncbi:putative MFS family arabinose efflux permease [Hymenobacter luteus]|uniref:MFS family arabinose efflux permease n=2 Tax=Hymenobacter TaxID=89966 RepID=A0ABR6K0R2_9BACT|nr:MULTISPECIES: MFS transporter [Hymenobacter]MBB4602585.1 putative MFS family arabinose efflux permease [Hymenobacter latericoloratus]MBB6060476.1 putative MFS family arabinose efflux permease [Hymenobacter luteus]